MTRHTTWNAELAAAAKDDGPITAKAPADETDWNRKFDSGYGDAEGAPVLAWSDTYVYFPVMYDGAESLERAPRNPQPEGQEHVGG